MTTYIREEKNIAFMKAYGAGGSRIEEFEQLYKRDTSNQFFDQRMIDGLELIFKMYNELLESLLKTFVPKYYQQSPELSKKWIKDNQGTIVVRDIAPGSSVSQIWVAGEYKGSVTVEQLATSYVTINWTPVA